MAVTSEGIEGPFAESRAWLLAYMGQARFKNEILETALRADWSQHSQVRCAYLLGAIWGRLRQMDSSLETADDYLARLGEDLGDSEFKTGYPPNEVHR